MRAAFLALLLLYPVHSNAATFSSDATDLWYNPNESGWGAYVIQQAEVLFITLFVYSPTGAATWYVAPATSYVGNSAGPLTFAGSLYQTNGPWFGGTFNPSAVGVREVGTIAFAMQNQAQAGISYTVDGTTVAKSITRQTWRTNALTGSYLGGLLWVASNCVNPANNGYSEEGGIINVSHSGASLSMTTANCTFTGTHTQTGRLGVVSGSYNCITGVFGTFNAFEIDAGISGFTARVNAQSNQCQFSGRFGGLKRQ